MFKILVLEDDTALNHSLCTYLRSHGYEAKGCYNGEEGYDLMYEYKFDLIISDIMMPGVDGFAFVQAIRSVNADIPILFVSARDDFAAKEKGYRAGIDDYMVKPLDFDELLLRIMALLRRANIASERSLCFGDFEMNLDERSVSWKGEVINLTVREFNLLYKLLSYPKKTFTRTQLMEEFWDVDTSSSPRTVDVYMTKLRGKLSDCDAFEIKTVHGLGYKAVIHV